jgi:zinc/manganese transport system permease protein
VLGVSTNELVPTAALAATCVVAVAVLYRRMMLSSVLTEVAASRGISAFGVELLFLAVAALASTMTVPVVGTLLIFTLMIGPPAAARSLVSRPVQALWLSVALALVTVWTAIAASYTTNYPVGFFVGTVSAALYAVGRTWASRRAGGRLVSATAAAAGA